MPLYFLYDEDQPAVITVTLYTADGRKAYEKVFFSQAAGRARLEIEPVNTAPGLYFYTVAFETGAGKRITKLKKLILRQ